MAFARTSHAQADGRLVLPGPLINSNVHANYDQTPLLAPVFAVPTSFQLSALPDTRTFPTGDFRPRGRSINDEKASVDEDPDAPMLRGTNVWQRLRDFRAHGRVRLLTLWETGGNAVSLQAGRRGEPSLQWTSRGMTRGGGTRGVLDQLFSVSLAGAGRSMHLMPRVNTGDPPMKPAKPDSGGESR